MRSTKVAASKYVLALGTAVLLLASASWASDDKDRSDIEKRLEASANVLNEIMATPDMAETHRTNIMRKLDFHSVADLTLYAVRNGIVQVFEEVAH